MSLLQLTVEFAGLGAGSFAIQSDPGMDARFPMVNSLQTMVQNFLATEFSAA